MLAPATVCDSESQCMNIATYLGSISNCRYLKGGGNTPKRSTRELTTETSGNYKKILRTQRKPIPPIHGERGIVRTNSEKAEAFADSFELQCRENQLDDEDEDHEEEVERRVRRLNRLPDEDEIRPSTPAWGHACETSLKKLQAVENVALRTAVGAPWFVRNRDLQRDLEWTPLREVIRTKATKAFEKATVHTNPLVREAVDYEAEERTTHKRPKTQYPG
ncbi:hypothetical protein NQ315_003940 [Exocentrus adspersus]|uniref:Uncharacterized protein n=1 Tax=Exocentrus adspersus TaxID=1586481 RepID=A0AAV8VZY0_9CUCU|nr:hypothetical protein NQ315_003940 [Exocentrus adspersus]